jgi:hypothetical protein
MKVRALSVDWDFSFGKGRNSYLKDLDALKQNIKTRILSWKNNCFFALDDGVDWNNWFGINTKNFLDLDIKRTILKTSGVIRLNNYESVITDRNIGIEINITTVYGNMAVVF